MHDSTTPPASPRLPDPGDPSAKDGIWGLDLWNGGAWFNEWFIERLQWTAHEGKRLADLRPYLPDGAWELLLSAIRDHLERQVPLDLTLRAILPNGRAQRWRLQGVAEHNAGGQPVYLSGNARDVTDAREPV